MTSAPKSVWDIPRNDTAACSAYHAEHGTTGDEWSVMIQLQDDPAELIEASKRWPPSRSQR